VSFQAYLDNIKSQDRENARRLPSAAREAGLLAPGTKATQIVAWLAKDYGLGRGHAMAIFAVFKRNGWIQPGKKARN